MLAANATTAATISNLKPSHHSQTDINVISLIVVVNQPIDLFHECINHTKCADASGTGDRLGDVTEEWRPRDGIESTEFTGRGAEEVKYKYIDYRQGSENTGKDRQD